MDNIVIAFIIIIIITLFWIFCYNPPHEHMIGFPYKYSFNKSENMVNQQDWADVSRGLNYSNANGYTPVIKMLNEMEKAQGADIQTDNRKLSDTDW